MGLVRCIPLSPAVGAEVVDFDITHALPESDQAELRRQFTKHHLLLVRGQGLTQDDHRFKSTGAGTGPGM